MDINEKIRSNREQAGLSQDELAERLGCDQADVSKWESGKHEPSNAYKRLLEMELDIDLQT